MQTLEIEEKYRVTQNIECCFHSYTLNGISPFNDIFFRQYWRKWNHISTMNRFLFFLFFFSKENWIGTQQTPECWKERKEKVHRKRKDVIIVIVINKAVTLETMIKNNFEKKSVSSTGGKKKKLEWKRCGKSKRLVSGLEGIRMAKHDMPYSLCSLFNHQPHHSWSCLF